MKHSEYKSRKMGICTLARKMTSFRQFKNIIVKLCGLRLRLVLAVGVGVSGNTFSVKRIFEQV